MDDEGDGVAATWNSLGAKWVGRRNEVVAAGQPWHTYWPGVGLSGGVLTTRAASQSIGLNSIEMCHVRTVESVGTCTLPSQIQGCPHRAGM